MRLRRLALAALLAAGAGAPAPAAQESEPPDRVAFRAARLTVEPQRALDAFAAVVDEYPESRYADRARSAILDLLITRFPARTKDIEQQVAAVLAATAKEDRPAVSDDLAAALVDGKVLLDRAQRLAEKAAKDYREQDVIDTARREAAAAKMPPPDEARLRRAFRGNRAIILGTLGRAYLAQGRTSRARRAFTDARALDPALAAAAEGLGAIALEAGDEQTAYAEFLHASLNGVLSAVNRQAFEGLFAARHGGSLAALESSLDQAYRNVHRNPVPVERYAAGPDRSDRTVLLEVFTGAGCPPCAAADLAVDAAMARFASPGRLAGADGRAGGSRTSPVAEVIVLMYHQHIPRPDPMTNPDTVERASDYDIPGVPMLVVDGTTRTTGGGPRADAARVFGRITPLIERRLNEPATAALEVTASLDGSTVQVQVQVTATMEEGIGAGLTLRLALVEDELRYSGESGIRFHPMVVRALATVPIEQASASIDHAFDVDGIGRALQTYLDEFELRNDVFGPITFVEKPAAIAPPRLMVVAFIQSGQEGRVLQSAVTPVRARGGAFR